MKKILNINDLEKATQHKLARITIYKEFEVFEEVLKIGIEKGRDIIEDGNDDVARGMVKGIRQVLQLLKDANDVVTESRKTTHPQP